MPLFLFKINSLSDKIYFIKIGLLNLLLFFAIYPITNRSVHGVYHHPYFSWELYAPLIDWMIIPYLSFNLLFLVPFFLLKKENIKLLGIAFALSTVVAGIIFYIFPTESGFVRIVPDGFTSIFYISLFSLDKHTNLIPSLHVTYTILYFIGCIGAIRGMTNKIFFFSWLLLIIISTFFTHQHHLLDIISGITLANVIYFSVSYKLRLENPQHRL